MADLELEGHTLGQKHQFYNKLVQDSIKNNRKVNIGDFNLDDSDIINLLNIDIASHNKNVEYILKVLTCDDMLYISRAIKQLSWLINDENYAHIINPTYLSANLFPKMCTKAITKFMKNIRNVLNDQKRAEEFYYWEENPEEAAKWLPCCSLQFVQENITNHQLIKTTLLRRLCEKSITVLEIYLKKQATHIKREALQATMFLLNSNIDGFLDIVETNEFPKFNRKATSLIMKEREIRVINKFDQYYDFIHLPTFIKCLKQENIKNFLLNQAENFITHRYFNLKRFLLFIRSMPQEIRFRFVEEVFINKIHESKKDSVLSEKEEKAMNILYNISSDRLHNNNHIWYQFAPFTIALQKMHEVVESVSSPEHKITLLELILTAAQNNLSDERAFLEYLRDKQKSAEYKVKKDMLTKLILKNNFIAYDLNTWNILDDIFKGIDIYNDSKKTDRVIIEAIILYNVIHNQKVSETIENQFSFNTLISYHRKLSEKEKEMVFTYLYKLIMAKITKCKTRNEEEFKEKVDILELALNLLKDYKKELESHPTLTCVIKDLIKVKKNQSWNVSIKALFNVKKAWRKLFFEESLEFCQTELALLYALKHGPYLLEKNKTVVTNILCNDKIPLRQVLWKIKIYWSTSLAKHITITYMKKLNTLENHNATIRGLSILLPFKHLQDLIQKYTPRAPDVDWANIDEVELSIQQKFAKNMHISRPQPGPETILSFAKGNYLQYALPSILSIFYNLNSLSSQKYILNLLDARVSLQKHGIRIAVSKFKFEQLISNFSNIWKNNKNVSIRSVIFKTVFELLCKEKESNKIKAIWELLAMFIDNITLHEDKTVYKLLFEVEKVPFDIKGLFYMKSYKFLHRLLHSGDEYEVYEHEFYTFTAYSREIIELLQPNFVVEIITEFINNVYTERQTEDWSHGYVNAIISSYLLCAPDVQTQLDRYEMILLPILKQSFTLWNTKHFIRNNLTMLLKIMRCDVKKYVIDMKKVNPLKMFLLIQKELQSSLEISAHYMLLTEWKLTVTFIEILDAHNSILHSDERCIKAVNEFGNKCSYYLREDCDKYFPRIYLLFVRALNIILDEFVPESSYLWVCRSLIQDNNFIQGYLAAIVLLSNTSLSELDENVKDTFLYLCQKISEHPSKEIKLHYYNKMKTERTCSISQCYS